MSSSASPTSTFRVADLRQNRPTGFDLRPNAKELGALADALGLTTLRKVVFTGEIRAYGKNDWELVGALGATVVQPCVVTLEPVTTRIDEKIERRFLAQMPELPDDDEEIEMPEDENSEPLETHIDVEAILHEALALNIPQFPRADGAELQEAVFTEAGKKAMTDEDVRPFAGLAALRDQLGSKEDE
ncbi:DUF177 domain-containing protein [uncultured Shimia sp.]|uniref:YceD family protein n=1 Tax=uncultured Shimia sp. TaxID=573152 RepID=UPI002605A877|nr:DUF177 domain-containing protein [uncultured Shimia sp.]